MKTFIKKDLQKTITKIKIMCARCKRVMRTFLADIKRIGLGRRRDILVVCMAAFVLAVFGVWQTATAAYDVRIDGEAILCVKNADAAEAIIEDYVQEQQNIYGESAAIRENISLDRKVGVNSNEVENIAELQEVLPEKTTIIADGVQLIVEDQPTVVVADENTAQEVLSRIESTAMAALDDAEIQSQGFRQQIAFKRVTTNVDAILDSEAAYIALSEGTAPVLQWEAVFEYRTREEMEPGVDVITTEDLPAGNKEVISEGVPGEQETLIRAVSLNGEVVTTEVVESVVLQEAVNAVVYEGTRTAMVSTVSRSNLSYSDVPISGQITATFGDSGSYWQSTHTGLDIAAASGTTVKAALSGTVTDAGWQGAYGNMITIDHGNGMETRYAHLSAIQVSVGDIVKRGDSLGACGATGNTTGPHLHFEVLIDGEFQNPTDYF